MANYLNVCACAKCAADLAVYFENRKPIYPASLPDNYFTLAWETRPSMSFNKVTNWKGVKHGINK